MYILKGYTKKELNMDVAYEPRTTTVFTSGNSQAVRLPKEFRFDSKQVFIERRGAEIVLRPKPLTMREFLDELPHIPDAPLQEPDHIEPSIQGW
jgi:antitoxin VapB